MAAQATDWLSLARMKTELRLGASADREMDLKILGDIEEAVSFLETRTELPLLDRTIEVPGVAAKVPLRIPRLAYLKSVDALHWREGANTPYANALAPGQAAVLERSTPDRMTGWRYWPDVAIPDRATMFRVTVTVGMDAGAPAHREVRKTLILMAREAFEGHAMAERTTAWERLARQMAVLDAPQWRV